jgi:transposase
MAEVSADKGYASKANAEVVANTGAVPYISFAAHRTGTGDGTWAKMFHYFQFKRTGFMAHYHKRSNVESTFSHNETEIWRQSAEQNRRCDG